MRESGSLLRLTPEGLYCAAGDFHVDPWKPVPRAVVTHAHADHARWGCESYLSSEANRIPLRIRLGDDAAIEGEPWGRIRRIRGVGVSFHPAGHILGSSQIRLEHGGEVWVVTGDYKRQSDPTAEAFEPVPCHTLITESTFGLPVFRWPDPDDEMDRVRAWWRENRSEGRTSLLYAYALGKAQRLLAHLDADDGPILVHGAVARLLPAYQAAGVPLPPVAPASAENARRHRGRALVLAPPSAAGTPWVRKFAPSASAFASGWMAIRGLRRRRAGDRGFVVSDHVDWTGILESVAETGAERVGVTHGYTAPVARYLAEVRGLDTFVVDGRFQRDDDA